MSTGQAGASSALACVELAWDAGGDARGASSDEFDAGFRVLGVRPVAVHSVQVRRLVDESTERLLDEALVCRWGPGAVTVCLHGGRVVVEGVLAWLAQRGAMVSDREEVPENVRFAAGDHLGDEVDPRMAAVRRRVWAGMSACLSARGIELLGQQIGRWEADGRSLDDAMDARDQRLMRLLEPPLVAAVGASNIGKSSLLNALARKDVALVHDSPGTTRDYVGAMVEVDGVVVRWVDTPGYLERFEDRGWVADAKPGVEEDLDRAAYAAAMEVVARADVVLACGDHEHAPRVPTKVREDAVVMRVRLRSDLAVSQARGLGEGFDAACTVRDAASIEGLGREIRRRLVRDEDLASERAWRWWRG